MILVIHSLILSEETIFFCGFVLFCFALISYFVICDSTWEKGPSRALFQNRVIATAGKSRLLATKCATYLVMKAKCSGVIAVSVHSFLSTAIS